MTHKCKLNLSLKIKHFDIVVVALGIVKINEINMPELERGYHLHLLTRLKN